MQLNENRPWPATADETPAPGAVRPPPSPVAPGGAKALVALGHDMRNALGAISAATDVLAIAIGAQDDPNTKEALEIIFRQTRNLSQLLDGLAQAAHGRAPARPIRPDRTSETRPSAEAEIDSLPPSRRQTVLVVQEDPALLDALCLALRLDSHAVSTATNGADGLEQLLATRPDVSIVGFGPSVPAFEFAGRARSAGYAGRMVVLSATGSTWRTRDALAAGFDACLSLPVERKALRASIGAG